ncbi:uncharacterized protein TRAVEDRAFT_56309 [Trametes versicolor FP-101664 SS1]|uniref:uncharacterized protein n=1 Tax=Trametes versicolor (strain FP-101664) TaxID=717944 RepID=UPI0004623FF0|nr:uncharacterized protein TRAVEDRAFT_56309 [Trametes versicolor FP-101664 SS1]EIW63206.1 hypothetical protein TRAVEDRAFT_56309 [Trametes versicolor FP-101664 SS1]
MAYNYYQSQMPGWGTSQFQFGAPPQPVFQPQPSWRGSDFYNAHALNPDPSLYESIMVRLRDILGMGVGHHEARHWHRRIYSGMVQLQQLLPADIGAAAAYEAYRTWKHNSFLYEPLSADRELQREGLIGMAIAETQRLWQYSGRPQDTYGLRAACEASASAANVLADRLFGWTSGGGGGGGVGYGSSYSGSNTGDAYAYDEGYSGRRGRSRHNSFNAPAVVRVGAPGYGDPLGSPYGAGGSPMPIPGAIPGAAAPYGAGMPGSYGAAPGIPGSYGAAPGYGGTYGYRSASPNPYGGASPNPYGVQAPYGAGAYPQATPGYPAPGYGAGQYGAGQYPGQYGAQQYGAGGGIVLPDGQVAPAGSTVIISKHRSRRDSSASSGHHHRHHRHRSSSRSRYDDYDRDRYGQSYRY